MDDRKRTKSEVEIRNGNGKIDKIKCKISTAGKSEDVSSIRIAILLYNCQYIYTAIHIYGYTYIRIAAWLTQRTAFYSRLATI